MRVEITKTAFRPGPGQWGNNHINAYSKSSCENQPRVWAEAIHLWGTGFLQELVLSSFCLVKWNNLKWGRDSHSQILVVTQIIIYTIRKMLAEVVDWVFLRLGLTVLSIKSKYFQGRRARPVQQSKSAANRLIFLSCGSRSFKHSLYCHCSSRLWCLTTWKSCFFLTEHRVHASSCWHSVLLLPQEKQIDVTAALLDCQEVVGCHCSFLSLSSSSAQTCRLLQAILVLTKHKQEEIPPSYQVAESWYC